MECKFAPHFATDSRVKGINRYIMECKLRKYGTRQNRFLELIDTLWNVNSTSYSTTLNGFCELIDTLWNVNFLAERFNYYGQRINRYIMECKLLIIAALLSLIGN